jgi:hypothetical protein
MRWGIGARILEMEREEAYQRGMAHAARLRAQQAAEKPRSEQRLSARAKTGGRRTITRDEAIALIAKKNPRGAFKLQMLPYSSKVGGR